MFRRRKFQKAVGAPVLTVRTRLFYARREIEAMLAEEPSHRPQWQLRLHDEKTDEASETKPEPKKAST